jgi:hypothetical protein
MQRVKTASLLIVTSVAFIINGCSLYPKPLYSYGDYSESYYNSKKEPTQKSVLALQESIKDAIKTAGESRSGRVAPGMYANLGYLYLKAGKTQEAILNFEKEKAIYPESIHFMDRMIKKVKLLEKGNL